MKSAPSCLGRALAISLVLHAAVIAGGAQLAAPVPRIVPLARLAQADLTVWLREPPVELEAPAPPRPRLLLPRNSSPNASAAAAAVPKAAPTARLAGEAAASATEQLERDLPYPPEAIARGLQGEVLVLLFLDASGSVIAARIEASSGHALLDEAAVRAARSLRSLPDSAPREALLPVRFRLR